MIPLSLSGLAGWERFGVPAGLNWIFGVWHAACFLPLTSCLLWIGPIPYAEENMPPTILSQSDEDGATIEVSQLGKAVFVAAADPEDGAVSFRWIHSIDGVIGNAEETDGVSQIWLDPTEHQKDQQLRCEISDEENATVTLRWNLVLLP